MKAETSRLEQSLVDTIAKIENNQSVTSSNIITHIDECKSYLEGLTKMMKSIVSDNKVSEDVISLQNKIKVLTEENQSILLQLKNEQSATLLIKCQFEDALKHDKCMIQEARTALHNMVSSSNSEVSFISNRLDKKN